MASKEKGYRRVRPATLLKALVWKKSDLRLPDSGKELWVNWLSKGWLNYSSAKGRRGGSHSFL